ncbi:hypothetical protein CHUAL_010682 [Chamberlinius hualienensis]
MAKLTEGMVIGRTRATDLASVRKLNCWGSELGDVSLVRHMPIVEVLSLSVNSITTLADFAHCPNLQELYVRKNKVSDLSEILYLRDLPKLRHFWLEDNPCATGDRYRLTVLKYLPNLKKLDNIVVNSDELSDAERYGLDLESPVDKKAQQFMQPSPTEKITLPPIGNATCSSSPSPPHNITHQTSPSLPLLNTERDNDYDAEGNVCSRSNVSAGSPDSLTHHSDIHERNYSMSNDGDLKMYSSPEERCKTRMTRSRSDNFTSLQIETEKDPNIENFEQHSLSMAVHHLEHQNQAPNHYPRGSFEFAEHFHHSHAIPPPPQYSHVPNAIHSDVYTDVSKEHDHPIYRDDGYRYHPPQQHPQILPQHHHLLKHYPQLKDKILDSPNRPYVTRPKNRNSNILSAVLCLIKELDSASLEVVDMAVHCRLEELDD